MIKVEIKVSKIHATDQGSVELIVETRKGDQWLKETGIVFEPGSVEASRTLLLEDKQRLVIVQNMQRNLVYDVKQNALISTDPPPEDLL